ncbi:MAG: stage sporulation protein [Paenibacillus sp.]|jgi:stage VI sporulation protein D|nr:stage sporulation protein [Paenibacillus sp.]
MEGGMTVSEQQPGLRFDIYERIYLPEGTSAIDELDEVELSPQIRVDIVEDQAMVRGSLLLAGTYTGQGEGETRQTKSLEHTIPVEITLPLNRVRNVNDISVEIDNFDIDLLSPRSLNVTGVLTLSGIEMLSNQADRWQPGEELLFVHEPPKAQPAPIEIAVPTMSAPSFPSAPSVPQNGFPRSEQVSQPITPVRTSSPPIPTSVSAPAAPTTASTSSAANDKIRDQLPDNTYDDYDALDQYDETDNAAQDAAANPQNELPVETEAAAVAEEADKGEMKIAFGSKKPDPSQPFDIKSYLSKEDQHRSGAAAQAASSSSTREKASRSEPPPEKINESDTLEWKNLFLSADEEQQFRKVRLCIVHKDDTLESIAKKYDRKPQEIRLYNSLTDQELSQGQVIYIP